MGVEIRPALDAEMEEYRRVAQTALMIAPELLPPEAMKAVRPDMTLCAFADGKIATAYAWWPLKMVLNGGMVAVAGITFVGTLPVFRRQGHLRRIIQKHFQVMHEQGRQPLAVLYASQAAIYQRYGYAVVSTRNSYKIEPLHLRFATSMISHESLGNLRELGEEEIPKMEELYQAFIQQRTGYLQRGKAWWLSGPFKPPARNEVLCKIVYEEKGQPLGYVIYTIAARNVPRGQPWQQVTIRDLAWLTPSAYQTIWEHFACMDLAMQIQTLFSPPDDPLPHLLLEPRRLNTESSDGLLARIVDVQKVIALRPFQEEGELVFDLKDDLCLWNSGRWQLRSADGQGCLQSTNRAIEATIPIDTLAMLLFGQISPTQATRMGRMAVADQRVLPKWDRIMATAYRPFCPDFF
ncbi:MAG: GNAT family N-acetyltransferase [Desulfobacteraceae bacterium]|nr:GNAT family N-acetyltransferase [Desulfobacteraceae bacterium]